MGRMGGSERELKLDSFHIRKGDSVCKGQLRLPAQITEGRWESEGLEKHHDDIQREHGC